MDKIKDNGLGTVEDLMRLDGAYEGEEYMKEEDEDESLTLEELDRLDSDTPVSEETSDEENAPSTPESTETVRVVSIAFRNEGKRLILCPEGMNLRTGDNVRPRAVFRLVQSPCPLWISPLQRYSQEMTP